jgi:hypothetical protein
VEAKQVEEAKEEEKSDCPKEVGEEEKAGTRRKKHTEASNAQCFHPPADQ